ncbi:S-adenosyl-L-methionine-dependent methyltransferase [Aureobasidium sp. EXF-8845]|nr:S-adenosyl-L-methionine-dependent methyltransferase [Aureobasidium sp. EXF-8845]KAI4840284.1 S-adenosyl-L-methionine-dependent methyltransferase [Aureobasidium sp. EXF-8846]
MPRLHPRTIHHARKLDLLLPLVLQATRDLTSAKNELRWLKEFITAQHTVHTNLWTHKLRKVCIDRSRGKPLQYILGSEYFGDLEIRCEKNVLIPRLCFFLLRVEVYRQETAISVTHLINRLHRDGSTLPKHMKILDLCTGTGCIPLLAHHEFTNKHNRKPRDLEIVGVDISPSAINLANDNLQRLVDEGILSPDPKLQFLQADILATRDTKAGSGVMSLDVVLEQYTSTSEIPGKSDWDILISNPPYISPAAFAHTTTRSVKRFEPRLALVPSPPSPLLDSDHGDLFYPRLLSLAAKFSTKVVLFEVADLAQAERIAEMAREQGIWDRIEIWRDDPQGNGSIGDDYQGCSDGMAEETVGNGGVVEEMVMDGSVKIFGAGNGRSVVAYRGEGRQWLHVDV